MFTLGLTNLDLGFRVKGWVLGIWFQILKNKKLNIKNFKIKKLFESFF